MIKKIIIIFFVLSILAGCVSTVKIETSLETVPVSADSTLNIQHAWPLNKKGTYLQKIATTIDYKGHHEEHIFSLYLTLDNEKLDAIAFNDISGRLYQLTWQPNSIEWSRSKYIPATLKPENIIADFLLTHLSAEQLKKSLTGAEVYEAETKQGKVRVIKNQSGVLRKMTYANPLGDLWKDVTIVNPKLGYTLKIQTVRQ
jgi:hypothetical protein